MSQTSESISSWQEFHDYRELLQLLANVAGREALLVMDIYWRGCPACAVPPSAFGQAILDLADRHAGLDWFSTHSLHWRINSFDNDLASPVWNAYKLFQQLTAGAAQTYGGGIPVENYTSNPPIRRAHFPQLFFLDGRHLNAEAIAAIQEFDFADRLFHPDCNAAVSNEGDPRCVASTGSGDLKLADDDVRNAIGNAFGHGSLLLQMINEHMYREPGDQNADFMRSEFDATVDFVIEQYGHGPSHPALAFRFDRRFK